MKKETKKIISEVRISMDDIRRMPAERKKDIIYNQLARGIADVIMKEMGSLPVTYKYKTDTDTGDEIHRLKINIISDKELERLKLYERLCSYEFEL